MDRNYDRNDIWGKTNMKTQQVASYGSWKSPITSDMIASGTTRLDQVVLDGENIYWIEMRPTEGGRCVVVRHSHYGKIEDITPSPFNARTRVHEYGGGAFVIHEGTIYFSNFIDSRLYCQEPGGWPRPITPEGKLRYADAIVDHHRETISVPALAGWFLIVGFGLLFGSFYPLTQIYQLDSDQERGDLTLVARTFSLFGSNLT